MPGRGQAAQAKEAPADIGITASATRARGLAASTSALVAMADWHDPAVFSADTGLLACCVIWPQTSEGRIIRTASLLL